MNQTPALEIRAVSKQLGPRAILQEASLMVSRGTAMGFLGRNGTGKSTLIRLLLGLTLPDRGNVFVLDRNVQAEGMLIRGLMGAVQHRPGLYERLSVFDNLALYATLYGVEPRKREQLIAKLIDTFELGEYRKLRTGLLSRGLLQKVALARALIHDPPVLLLDEPFTGLDPIAAEGLCAVLRELVTKNGKTIFLTSHDLQHVHRCCDHVAVLANGRITEPTRLDGTVTPDRLEEVFRMACEVSNVA